MPEPAPAWPLTYEVCRVEDLHLANLVAAGVGEVAVVVVHREGAQSVGVGGRVADRVQYLHVADVVDVEALLQTHDQPLQKPSCVDVGLR